jgi:hypothetical protein
MNVTLNLELEDGRSLTTQKPGVPLSFTWTRPTAGQIQTLQKQAEDLLAKAMISATALSASELSVFRTLLMTEETSRTITRDKALAALKQRQIEGTSRFEEVMALVYSKWNTDPVVVAFYLDALRTRGPEALSDLTRFFRHRLGQFLSGARGSLDRGLSKHAFEEHDIGKWREVSERELPEVEQKICRCRRD